MLDDAEFRLVSAALRAGFHARPGAGSERSPFQRMLDTYRELTGVDERNPNAVLHHVLSIYGPPCATYGKPLRTPRAKFCAACGAPAKPATTEQPGT